MPIGQVFALSATDKLPTTALQTVFGVGGLPGNQIRYLLIIAASSIAGGTLVPDTEAKLIVEDGDEDDFYGDPGAEGPRMVRMARRIDGLQIKCATFTQSGGAAATAQIVIDGPWSAASSGPVRFRIGGQAVERSVLSTDDAQSFAEGLADQINLDGNLPVTATAAAGSGTTWVVTLVWKSYGTRGNDAILWKNDDYKPNGMTISLGGDVGGSITSAAGPWALSAGDTLVVAFNAGGNQTFTIAATAAIVTGAGATYNAVTAGHTLTLTILGTQYVVTFAGTENTQALYHAVIQAVVNGVAIVTNAGGQTRITTARKGSSAVASVAAGDADVLTSLGLSVGAFTNAGPNNVADLAAVTAAEWVTIMAAITNGTAEATSLGALKLMSATTGSGGTVQVQASSTADDEMTLDNSVHNGGSGAGPSVASGGVRFTGGAATENLTALLSTLETESFWTGACAVIDATNLGRLETFIDEQAGPLVREFHNIVVGSTKAFASSTSLAQTTLDNQRFEMIDMEEGETPAEEQAAWVAALRHQREQSASGPNQKYDGIPTPFVPQEASSKRMSRSRQVAALDVGLTCIPTKNNVAYLARAITTRSLTALGGADDGTIDVGQARTPDVINEEIGALWEAYTDSEDTTAHHTLRNDPAPGEEADIPAGMTYPQDWQRQVQLYMKGREAAGWVVQVDANPTVVNMHPTSSTPRFIQYTPVIVAPLTHQLEGTIAQTKFVPQ
jgi:phage tail sheath gpL-like